MQLLIVSNLPLWSDLVSNYVKDRYPDTVCSYLADFQALEEYDDLENADLVFVDIEMKDKESSEVIRYILNLEKGPEVFVFSALKNVELLKDSLKYRVHSYIVNDHELSFLDKAMDDFLKGNKTIGRKSRKEIKQWVSKHESMISNISLSKREREILRMICEEKTSTEISQDLFISEHTVLTHRKNLLKKVGCKNTVGLVHYAYQNDVLSLT